MLDIIENIPQLERLGNVAPEDYLYYEKVVTPAADLSLTTAYLKWYNLYPVDTEITPEQFEDCRAFLATEAVRLKLQNDLGFVILHRAGKWLLLLLTTWRNTNEMWEAVYAKDLSKDGDYNEVTFENNHRGTYCVWELGIVWHERHAWVRFLSSKRDNEAKLAYINDRFSGSI